MIEDYSFGKMSVKTKNYVKDLIILGDEIFCPWIRAEGHRLSISDVSKVVDYKPEVLVIGTGFFGMMKVDKDLINYFKETHCRVFVLNSKEAASKFNEMSKDNKTAAVFHLTC